MNDETSWFSGVLGLSWYWLVLLYLFLGFITNFVAHVINYRITGRGFMGNGRNSDDETDVFASVGIILTWPLFSICAGAWGLVIAALYIVFRMHESVITNQAWIQKANNQINKLLNLFKSDEEKD